MILHNVLVDFTLVYMLLSSCAVSFSKEYKYCINPVLGTVCVHSPKKSTNGCLCLCHVKRFFQFHNLYSLRSCLADLRSTCCHDISITTNDMHLFIWRSIMVRQLAETWLRITCSLWSYFTPTTPLLHFQRHFFSRAMYSLTINLRHFQKTRNE